MGRLLFSRRTIHTVNSYSPTDKKTLRKKNIFVSARLAHKNNEPSSLDYGNKSFSVSARVLKGDKHRTTDDSALIFISKKLCAFGVFDGHGSNGGIISPMLADLLLKTLVEEDSPNGPLTLLRSATKILLPAYFEQFGENGIITSDGGTTALFVFVYPDWKFHAVSVADSALYKYGKQQTTRFFSFSDIYGVCKDATIPFTALYPDNYIVLRNVISDSVNLSDSYTVQVTEGRLDPGETMIIATDGLTKNLRHMVDSRTGLMLDISGCEDLHALMSSANGNAAEFLLDTIRKRMKLSQQIRDKKVIENNTVLAPADDDLGIITVTHKK
ncbi:protein phosphatase 2C domain-containing protein [Candidatus Micrarchaeota archaeon]|nr:protein phosphatase 2C domain-containing protein [Candidatus Micrarchaeota archaeon]